MSSHLFASVLARLKLLTGSDTDVQLARALKVSPQTLSSWKVRDSIPYSLCVDLARQHGCSLDWLLLGERNDSRAVGSQDSWQNDLLGRLCELSHSDRQSVLLYIEDKQRIRQLERQLQELTKHASAAH
ncbi:transcriptional regulator [Pseudomonas putida]|uniref:Transcriptional regulator n=1 Tax=Pseudomonas putida TaxID=303 RepID=A0A2S3X2X0_PSEPU|nr:helix-turn-helix domain-containing protein [Pseudomonas putida]POG09897.1 transcriptional regulator [Pseudomonas putida]POG16041.1 transcriptional regulator [Pseudomonas putida]